LTYHISESVNRSADGMIQIHGANASVQAHLTLARMKANKENSGEHMWLAIVRAIEKKQTPLGPKPSGAQSL
jgi:hypothetical protein